jgi:glutaredoxin-like protein NrdH
MAALWVYTKENCPGCQQTKRLLHFLRIPYEERRVDVDPEHRERLMALGYRSLPVVEVEGVGAVPGADPSQIEQLLVKAGLM